MGPGSPPPYIRYRVTGIPTKHKIQHLLTWINKICRELMLYIYNFTILIPTTFCLLYILPSYNSTYIHGQVNIITLLTIKNKCNRLALLSKHQSTYSAYTFLLLIELVVVYLYRYIHQLSSIESFVGHDRAYPV